MKKNYELPKDDVMAYIQSLLKAEGADISDIDEIISKNSERSSVIIGKTRELAREMAEWQKLPTSSALEIKHRDIIHEIAIDVSTVPSQDFKETMAKLKKKRGSGSIF